jgi:hypothetical protein
MSDALVFGTIKEKKISLWYLNYFAFWLQKRRSYVNSPIMKLYKWARGEKIFSPLAHIYKIAGIVMELY